MRPYARTIINTMWQEDDHVLIVTRHGADNDAFPDIPASAFSWIDYPTSKVSKALFRFHPANVKRAIRQLISSHAIDMVYSLTGNSSLLAV